MAPATKPPSTPAPTAHPQQRASAGVGVAAIAVATVAAAAKATSVFFISLSLSVGGCRGFSAGGGRGPVPRCGVPISPPEAKPPLPPGNIIRLIGRNLVSPETAGQPFGAQKRRRSQSKRRRQPVGLPHRASADQDPQGRGPLSSVSCAFRGT